MFYVNHARNCVVIRENLHSWHKFYMTAGRDGRDKSQLWIYDIHTWHIMYIINAKSLAYDTTQVHGVRDYTIPCITDETAQNLICALSVTDLEGVQKKSSTIFQEFTFIQ